MKRLLSIILPLCLISTLATRVDGVVVFADYDNGGVSGTGNVGGNAFSFTIAAPYNSILLAGGYFSGPNFSPSLASAESLLIQSFLSAGETTTVSFAFADPVTDATFHIGRIDGKIVDFTPTAPAADVTLVSGNLFYSLGTVTHTFPGNNAGFGSVFVDGTFSTFNLDIEHPVGASADWFDLQISFDTDVQGQEPAVVPEPATVALGVLGLGGLIRRSRRAA